MSDIIEFIVRIKEMATDPLRRIASASRTSFASVDRDVTGAQREVANLGREADRTSGKMQGLGRKISSMFGSAGKLMRQFAPAVGLVGITAGIGTSIDAAMQGSAQKVSFQTMSGDVAGSKLYADLTKFAQDSIFGNELYGISQTMLAFGASAKEIMPDLKMLGDISMGNKERLQSLALAFSQVRAAGKLTGNDLLQFVNAGFNPLQVIAEKTGIGMHVLRDKVEKGLVSFKNVKQAFISATSEGGRFYNMTQKIAETPFGKWEAFKGQLQGIALQFGTKLLPAVERILTMLPAMADGFSNFLTTSGVPFLAWVAKSAIWMGENWKWLKLVFIAVVALRVGYLAYSRAVAIANTANELFNLTLASTPIGAVVALIATLVSALGLLAITTTSTMDTYKDKVGSAATAGIGSSDITQAYADAGAEHGKAYTAAVVNNMPRDLAAKMFPTVAKEERAKAEMAYNSQPALVSAINKALADSNLLSKTPLPASAFVPKAASAAKDTVLRLASPTQLYQQKNPDYYLDPFYAKNKTDNKVTGKDDAKFDLGGTDDKSKGITGGGVRNITFNIDTVGVKGGFTINAANVTEGKEQLEEMVLEAMIRVVDSAGGAMAN